jgi:acyl-CoA synthetase (AMP-forming)/AMP-acid ligase II
LPDRDLGERVVAAVVVKAPVTPDELLSWLSGKLSGYKKPHAVSVVDALPKNAMGKLRRDAVRAMLGS